LHRGGKNGGKEISIVEEFVVGINDEIGCQAAQRALLLVKRKRKRREKRREREKEKKREERKKEKEDTLAANHPI
jgi:hypothetical protein